MKKTARRLALHRETLKALTPKEWKTPLAGGILTDTCATGCYACEQAPSVANTASWCICE